MSTTIMLLPLPLLVLPISWTIDENDDMAPEGIRCRGSSSFEVVVVVVVLLFCCCCFIITDVERERDVKITVRKGKQNEQSTALPPRWIVI